MDALEAAEIADRSFFSGAAADVQLHYFMAIHLRRVLDRRANLSALRHAPGAQARIPERRVAQSEAERVEGLAFEIAVGVALHVVVGELGKLAGALVERYGETARRVVRARQRFRDGCAGFFSAVPGGENRGRMLRGVVYRSEEHT